MKNDQSLMEKIESLAKRRGFVFQAGELYGGLAGVYDYGPLGSLLKRNIVDAWIQRFVHQRHDTFLLDSAVVMGAAPLTASGHVGGFVDPLIDDLVTKKRYRADHLLEEYGVDPRGMTPDQMSAIFKERGFKSPEGNQLSDVRQFNMMLETKLGASEDSSSQAFLRPETAQGIFVNYKNIVDSMHPKIPFGVAQVGKAYRNEITPRNFIFRLRELEQMEIEYFIHPSMWKQEFEYWRDEMNEWIQEVGIDPNMVHEIEIGDADRAHYSKRTIDFEFEYPFGKKELYGLAYRTDYDLTKHSEASKTKLQYTDPYTNETYIPHVIEPSMGLDRTFLAVLLSAYREDLVNEEIRSYLALPYHLAPYKISVSPLVKNKEDIIEKAQQVYGSLKAVFGNVSYDDNGNIGKRYRRQDEIGTAFCVVIDYETLENATVSIRDRDTTEQIRVALSDIEVHFKEVFNKN